MDAIESPTVFRHSGDCGDIIYSLPVVRAFGGGLFFVDPNSCPGGKSPLAQPLADALLPLLSAQPYIHYAGIYDGRAIGVDLDRFRTVGMSVYSNHLSHSHCIGLGIQPSIVDVSGSWLEVEPHHIADIVICRTGRRPGDLAWSELSVFQDRCLFVGKWEEYLSFRRQFGLSIPFYHAANFLDLANVTGGARLVVSDQTFVFALAEAVKVPRVLEVMRNAPNCMPQSSNGHTFLNGNLIEDYLFRSVESRFCPNIKITQSISSSVKEDVIAPEGIHCFLHVCAINNWKEIVRSQIMLMRASGLYERMRLLTVGIVGTPPSLNLFDDPKIQIGAIRRSITEFEFPTLSLLYQSSFYHNGVVLYFHTKGVSKSTSDLNASDWRSYLEHFAITRFSDCLAALESADVCGVNWQQEPKPHFSGNFWWARAAYIRSLSSPSFLYDRCDAEFWVGGGTESRAPRWKSLHQSNVNHYHQRYPRGYYQGNDRSDSRDPHL